MQNFFRAPMYQIRKVIILDSAVGYLCKQISKRDSNEKEVEKVLSWLTYHLVCLRQQWPAGVDGKKQNKIFSTLLLGNPQKPPSMEENACMTLMYSTTFLPFFKDPIFQRSFVP